jgi:hypothetical protein
VVECYSFPLKKWEYSHFEAFLSLAVSGPFVVLSSVSSFSFISFFFFASSWAARAMSLRGRQMARQRVKVKQRPDRGNDVWLATPAEVPSTGQRPCPRS